MIIVGKENIEKNYKKKLFYKNMLLHLDNQDLVRKRVVLTTSMLYIVVFVSFALMQSNLLKLSKNQLTVFSNFMDIFALFLCLSFLLAAIFNVFYLEVKKSKIQEQIEKLEQQKSKKSNSKFADFCDKHANKVDLLGSVCTSLMQTIAVFSLTIPTIFNCSKIPYGTAFNLQGIVDTIGNILFLIAAGMFLCSYLIRYVKDKNQNQKKESIYIKSRFNKPAFILSTIFFGTFLIFAGKVLLSFECRSGPMYTGITGPLGMDIFPLALIVRAVGMLIFCIGYVAFLSNSVKENKILEREVKADSRTLSVSDLSEIESLYGSREKLL